MLNVAKVRWRNFMSYGDYVTEVDFSKLSTCSIVGQIKKGGKLFDNKSNGAGKSTIVNAILWAVFGRTMHRAMPGDNIINKYVKKNCWVQVVMKNGDVITKTRLMDGHSELLFETKDVDRTLSTVRQQQLDILKEYSLDWEIFCGSAFMNQYGKQWLEMTKPSMKKALERLLQVDRFNYRAAVAKEKMEQCKIEIANKEKGINENRMTLRTIIEELDKTRKSNDQFEANRKIRADQIRSRCDDLENELSSVVKPDIADLTAKWALVDQIKQLIYGYEVKCRTVDSNIVSEKRRIEDLTSDSKSWTDKIGTLCSECEQTVDEGHACTKGNAYAIKRDMARGVLVKLEAERSGLAKKINDVKFKLSQELPSQTIQEAKLILNNYASIEKQIGMLRSQIDKIDKEENPHGNSIIEFEKRVSAVSSIIEGREKDIKQYDVEYNHFNYIYKFYHDSKKAKSLVVGDYIPYFNDRLAYYLNIVDLDLSCTLGTDLTVSFTDTVYDYYSGGEKKRADMAFMLAVYDMVNRVFGPQCNILVMDDVDGWLDDYGTDVMIDLIKNELSSRADVVLIVSHTKKMQGQFANEIRIIRDDDNNRMSYIEDVR